MKYIAVRRFVHVHCGAHNSHVPDRTTFLGLLADGTEVMIDAAAAASAIAAGVPDRGVGHVEIPGGYMGGVVGFSPKGVE